MTIDPITRSKLKTIVFTATEPSSTSVLWGKANGDNVTLYVFKNGSWERLNTDELDETVKAYIDTQDAITLNSAKDYSNNNLTIAEQYVNNSVSTLRSEVSSKYLPLTGGTLTGTLTVPAVMTGTAASSYFQTMKMRGEGNADAYYHAVDWGYSGHNRVDFYEYGGEWYFWRSYREGKKDGCTCVGSIRNSGWNGCAVLTGTPTAPTAATGTNTTQIATTAFVNNSIKIPIVTTTDSAVTLQPSKMYELTPSADTTITLQVPTDTTIVNEYMCEISMGDTAYNITLPSDINWAEDEPTFEANTLYEINIRYSSKGYFGLIHSYNL